MEEIAAAVNRNTNKKRIQYLLGAGKVEGREAGRQEGKVTGIGKKKNK